MKRITALLLVLCLALALTACSGSTSKTASNGEPDKVLVAYFSCSGCTQKVAEDIAEAFSATLYEIVPETPYTAEELENADRASGRISEEQYGENVRPAIAGSVENMEDFTVVFLGYPIWWGDAPKIISTFLESYDFSGKTIIPFCTSHTSGLGSSATALHGLTSKSANWLEGVRFSSSTARRTVLDWLKDLPINVAEE